MESSLKAQVLTCKVDDDPGLHLALISDLVHNNSKTKVERLSSNECIAGFRGRLDWGEVLGRLGKSGITGAEVVERRANPYIALGTAMI